MIKLRSIRFDHDVDKGRSALTLRRNADESIPLPEWRRGPDSVVRRAPVAYAAAPTRGHTIQLEVEIDLDAAPFGVTTFELRAVPPPSPIATWLATYGQLAWQTAWALGGAPAVKALLAAGTSVLGSVAPVTLTFDAGERRRRFLMELSRPAVDLRGVGRHSVVWNWQYRLGSAEPWRTFDESKHEVFTTLGLPTAPWQQVPDGPSNSQLPWTEVLELACSWASGARSADDAAMRITSSVFALGEASLFEYGCPIWAMEMYAKSFPPWNHFDCTAFLERVGGGLGNGPYVNCTDCATIVSTLANILGCDLWQARMGSYYPHFETNWIRAIGTDEWTIPCGMWPGFSFHEVAWKGDCTFSDAVFDACLLVDIDDHPRADPQWPLLPVNMPFVAAYRTGYRDRLSTPAGRAYCIPRPFERRRRRVF
jgi:hypothetical protein